MMTSQHSYSSLFQQIDADTSVITPNRRLSATLHTLYQAYQASLGHTAWATPDILPVTSWIQRAWSKHTSSIGSSPSLLLNPAQAEFLWEKIVTDTKESEQLLQVAETADLAKTAWGLLKQWQVDVNQACFEHTNDCASLRRWGLSFEEVCKKNQWLDNESLAQQVLHAIKNKTLILPQKIILAGFTERSPQLNALLACAANVGSRVISYGEPAAGKQTNERCHRISLLDTDDEIQTMARWAKATLEKHPSATIGCVLPSLDKMRDRVVQIFSAVFAPEQTYTVDRDACPFNVSAGKSLAQYPIIATALQLLALNKKMIPITQLSYLLASPFLGDAETERIQRSVFNSLLRQKNIANINLSMLVQKSDDMQSLSLTQSCSRLATRLRQFIALINDNQQTRTYHEWATTFTQLLTTLGWPGERSINSEEYQVVTGWLKLLFSFSSLDEVSAPVSYQRAWQQLQKTASKSIFQPQTPIAPIQVLGILEAAGLPFDFIWVGGMDDLTWPPQPKPNPFIPKQLQRELHMPHATAERELHYCISIMQQFAENASHVLFSYAKTSDDMERQASPLIRNLPELPLNELELAQYLTPCERIFQSKQTESLDDNIAPAIATDTNIRGGIDVIKQQALCPFKAFAKHRLHAKEIEELTPGLRAKDRGTLTHRVLELIWNQLHDHTTLVSIADEDLHTLVDKAISDSISLYLKGNILSSKLMVLEKQRLHQLVWDWLQIEKKRPPFIVDINENASQITLAKLTYSIRIDRIDKLADGKKLIIDYKTGKNNIVAHWFSERPEEPQLPLYSLLDPDNTVGITYAQIYPGNSGFKGISQYDLDVSGIKSVSDVKQENSLSWGDQKIQWQRTLTQLSADFAAGVANVNPKDAIQTCQWCTFKPLCRINEETRSCDVN